MTWPAYTYEDKPRKLPSGVLQMTEAYWPFGLLKITIALIPFGFYWWTRDLPGGSALLWPAIPFLGLAISGLTDVVFYRRYQFFPKERKARIEGFSLFRGSFSSDIDYADISVTLHSQWVFSKPIHKRFFAMFSFSGEKVAFFSSEEKEEAITSISRLRAIFGLNEPNKAPEPTTMAVTPRATEGDSK